MPYVIYPGGGFRWVDPAEEYQLNAGESISNECPVNESVEIDAIKSRARSMREVILNRLTGIQFSQFLAGQTAAVNAIETAKQGLRDITSIEGLAEATTGAEAELAIKNRYYELADALQSAAPTAVSAFVGLES